MKGTFRHTSVATVTSWWLISCIKLNLIVEMWASELGQGGLTRWITLCLHLCAGEERQPNEGTAMLWAMSCWETLQTIDTHSLEPCSLWAGASFSRKRHRPQSNKCSAMVWGGQQQDLGAGLASKFPRIQSKQARFSQSFWGYYGLLFHSLDEMIWIAVCGNYPP